MEQPVLQRALEGGLRVTHPTSTHSSLPRTSRTDPPNHMGGGREVQSHQEMGNFEDIAHGTGGYIRHEERKVKIEGKQGKMEAFRELGKSDFP